MVKKYLSSMEKRTFESVITDLNKAVAERQVLTPEVWMEAALCLNLLIENQEQPKLFELMQQVALAEIVAKELCPDWSDKQIERKTRATPLWVDMKKQEAKIKMANNLILLAKKHASLSSDLMRQNL